MNQTLQNPNFTYVKVPDFNKPVPDFWIKTKHLCPACKRPLWVINDTGGSSIWCPHGDCKTMADGPNEGAHGKSEMAALATFLARLGLDKNYRVEYDPSDDPPEESKSPKTDSSAKKGRRGRKSKNDSSTYKLPKGEFTMKEFCELNDTYPLKALPFFKANKVRECGKRPTASGRGKPAVLYTT